jgi:hypothetical protein
MNQDHGEVIPRHKLDAGAFGPLRVVPRFRHTPDISGMRGHDAASYDGLASRAKNAVRAFANRLLPGWWI